MFGTFPWCHGSLVKAGDILYTITTMPLLHFFNDLNDVKWLCKWIVTVTLGSGVGEFLDSTGASVIRQVPIEGNRFTCLWNSSIWLVLSRSVVSVVGCVLAGRLSLVVYWNHFCDIYCRMWLSFFYTCHPHEACHCNLIYPREFDFFLCSLSCPTRR